MQTDDNLQLFPFHRHRNKSQLYKYSLLTFSMDLTVEHLSVIDKYVSCNCSKNVR